MDVSYRLRHFSDTLTLVRVCRVARDTHVQWSVDRNFGHRVGCAIPRSVQPCPSSSIFVRTTIISSIGFNLRENCYSSQSSRCPRSGPWSPCCMRARRPRTGETPAHYALAPVICRPAACGQDARAPARRPRIGIVQGRHLASPRTGRPNDPTVPYSGAFVNPCAILSPCHSQSMTTRRMAI